MRFIQHFLPLLTHSSNYSALIEAAVTQYFNKMPTSEPVTKAAISLLHALMPYRPKACSKKLVELLTEIVERGEAKFAYEIVALKNIGKSLSFDNYLASQLLKTILRFKLGKNAALLADLRRSAEKILGVTTKNTHDTRKSMVSATLQDLSGLQSAGRLRSQNFLKKSKSPYRVIKSASKVASIKESVNKPKEEDPKKDQRIPISRKPRVPHASVARSYVKLTGISRRPISATKQITASVRNFDRDQPGFESFGPVEFPRIPEMEIEEQVQGDEAAPPALRPNMKASSNQLIESEIIDETKFTQKPTIVKDNKNQIKPDSLSNKRFHSNNNGIELEERNRHRFIHMMSSAVDAKRMNTVIRDISRNMDTEQDITGDDKLDSPGFNFEGAEVSQQAQAAITKPKGSARELKNLAKYLSKERVQESVEKVNTIPVSDIDYEDSLSKPPKPSLEKDSIDHIENKQAKMIPIIVTPAPILTNQQDITTRPESNSLPVVLIPQQISIPCLSIWKELCISQKVVEIPSTNSRNEKQLSQKTELSMSLSKDKDDISEMEIREGCYGYVKDNLFDSALVDIEREDKKVRYQVIEFTKDIASNELDIQANTSQNKVQDQKKHESDIEHLPISKPPHVPSLLLTHPKISSILTLQSPPSPPLSITPTLTSHPIPPVQIHLSLETLPLHAATPNMLPTNTHHRQVSVNDRHANDMQRIDELDERMTDKNCSDVLDDTLLLDSSDEIADTEDMERTVDFRHQTAAAQQSGQLNKPEKRGGATKKSNFRIGSQRAVVSSYAPKDVRRPSYASHAGDATTKGKTSAPQFSADKSAKSIDSYSDSVPGKSVKPFKRDFVVRLAPNAPPRSQAIERIKEKTQEELLEEIKYLKLARVIKFRGESTEQKKSEFNQYLARFSGSYKSKEKHMNLSEVLIKSGQMDTAVQVALKMNDPIALLHLLKMLKGQVKQIPLQTMKILVQCISKLCKEKVMVYLLVGFIDRKL